MRAGRSWWWHRTAELLLERGVPSVAPLLPSCGEFGRPAGADGPGLPEDVAAVRQVLQDGDEPTVVVAHSYGGSSPRRPPPASLSAPPVAGVQLPARGRAEPLRLRRRQPAPFLDVDPEGGTFGVRPEFLVETFLQDCDPDTQAQAADRLARQSLHVTAQPVGAAAWQQVPSTYLVCAQDKGRRATATRVRRKAGAVVELETGHHPFLSQPAAVRDLLLGL